jgi:O-antigen ligase
MPTQSPGDRLLIGVMGVWAAWLLLAPSIGFDWIPSWHNEQRAVQLLLLAATAAVYCAGAWSGRSALPALSLPAWIFVLLGLLSALRAAVPAAALAEIGLLLLLATAVATSAVFFAADPARRMRWACRFALLAGASYVVGVAVRYAAAIEMQQALDLSVALLGYANPRFPSALHVVLLPLIGAVVVDPAERRGLRIAAFIVLALLVTVNLALGTRAIWFAFALALPAVALLAGWRPAIRRLYGTLGAAAAAGLLAYLALFKWLPTGTAGGEAIASPLANLTLTFRDVLWKMAYDAIVQSPLLGVGPMQFAAIDNRFGAHPHNWVLQIGAEWGLPALAVAGVLVATLLVRMRRLPADGEAARGVAAFHVAAMAALAMGFVDGNLVMPVSQTAAAVVFGASLAGTARAPATAGSVGASGHLHAIATTAAALAAVIAVGSFALDSLAGQADAIARFRAAWPGAWLLPRFWEHGLVLP